MFFRVLAFFGLPTLQDGPRGPKNRPKTAQEGARMAPSRVSSRSYLHLSSATCPELFEDPPGTSRDPPGTLPETPGLPGPCRTLPGPGPPGTLRDTQILRFERHRFGVVFARATSRFKVPKDACGLQPTPSNYQTPRYTSEIFRDDLRKVAAGNADELVTPSERVGGCPEGHAICKSTSS